MVFRRVNTKKSFRLFLKKRDKGGCKQFYHVLRINMAILCQGIRYNLVKSNEILWRKERT